MIYIYIQDNTHYKLFNVLQDFSAVTKLMLQEGGKYLKRCENATNRISKLGVPFVFDGAVNQFNYRYFLQV
jgi:hypothetical protein